MAKRGQTFHFIPIQFEADHLLDCEPLSAFQRDTDISQILFLYHKLGSYEMNARILSLFKSLALIETWTNVDTTLSNSPTMLVSANTFPG
jgi:hypothetical protein